MSLILRAVFLSKYSSYHSVMHEEKFLDDFFNYLLNIAQARSCGVAWGGESHPWIRGYQIFATPINSSTIENMRVSVTD